jgi:DDE superfamily endonuclease
VAAGHSVDPIRWRAAFDELMGRIAGRFGRVEPRRNARALVLGLLADLPRKNCWTIAEHARTTSPDRLQHLLARAVWDANALRDDVRDYVISHLGDPEAVLVIDETGDLKKGTTTAGVQRQYTGTAGKIDNSQVAVYLAYATKAGHALIDRKLDLPRSWTDDRDRCRAAGVPDQVTFATKPTLATRMLTRALDAGVVAGWVAGDEVYGADPKLRAALQARGLGYVLAVACDHRGPRAATPTGPTPWCPLGPGSASRPGAAPRATASTTGRLSNSTTATATPLIGTGCSPAATPPPANWPSTAAGCLGPCRWPPWSATPDAAGGSRRHSRPARACAALDEHQVRRWPSWYRWTTLAMLALAFLVVLAVTERTHHPPPAGLAPLTCNELQHLFAALLAQPSATSATGRVGQSGGADIKPAPAAATTDDKLPTSCEHHEHGGG